MARQHVFGSLAEKGAKQGRAALYSTHACAAWKAKYGEESEPYFANGLMLPVPDRSWGICRLTSGQIAAPLAVGLGLARACRQSH